jgi:outer membrane protein assembly factor BamB
MLLAGALAVWALSREHGNPPAERRTTVEAPAPRGFDWPTYGRDNARTHAAPFRLPPPYRRLWSVYGDSSFIEFPPVVADGHLYFATDRGRATAVDSRTGRRLWQRPLGHCVAASPAVAGGIVLLSAMGPPPCDRGRGELLALDSRSGMIRWRLPTTPIESSPLVFGDVAIVGARDGRIYAVDVRTGSVRWQYQTGAAVKGGAAASDGLVFIGSYDGYVYALRGSTGKLVWRARTPGDGHFYATPSVGAGVVFIGATDGFVLALDATTGLVRWRRRLPSYVYSSAAIAGERVFVGSYDHRLYALDAATGRRLWSVRGAGPVSGAPTVLGELVFFSTCGSCSQYESDPAARRTYAADVRSGRVVWTFADGEYSPVVTDGLRLYLTGFTTIYALAPVGARRPSG